MEPGVEFYCDLDYDPFLMMQRTGKRYSFVLAMMEVSLRDKRRVREKGAENDDDKYIETCPTLWTSVKNWMDDHPEYIAQDNALRFVTATGESYSQ